MHELKSAFRHLIRQPLFALAICGSTALGVGLDASTFAVVHAAFFKPLPYRHPESLVNMYAHSMGVDGQSRLALLRGRSTIIALRSTKQVVEGIEVFTFPSQLTLADAEGEVWKAGFSVGLPSLLGIDPLAGRFLAREDVGAGTVVISDAFWARRFGRGHDAIGAKLRFPDGSKTIIGVMPPTFRYLVGSQTEVWEAITENDGTDVVARLAPGVSPQDAARILSSGPVSLQATYGMSLTFDVRNINWKRESAATTGVVGAPLFRDSVFGLMAAVTCILLVVCANVSNLLASNVLKRSDDFATHLALGATPWRLIRRLALEVLLLSVVGGLLALTIAWGTLRLIPALAPRDLVDAIFVSGLPVLDLTNVAYVLALLIVVALFCCLAPAFRIARMVAVNAASARRSLGSSRAAVRLRELLQTAQIAFMVVVLVQAGLFVNSTWRLANTPLGFDQTNLSYVVLRYPIGTVISAVDLASQYETGSQIASRLLSRPGVISASLGESPINPRVATEEIGPERQPDLSTKTALSYSYVGPGYFRVTGIALKAGRDFLSSDTSTTEKVVIINQRVANRFWPGGDPIGQRLLLYSPPIAYRVVGVVGDIKTVDVVRSDLQIYRPLLQSPGGGASLIVRSLAEPRVLYGFVTDLIAQLSPKVTVVRFSTVERSLRETAPGAATVFFAILLTALAVTGLLIALVGLYSTISLNVEQRLGEIGVRVALGATPRNVVFLILTGVVRQLSIGLLLGLLGSRMVASYLASQRFHVSSFDAVTSVGVALVVICGGLVSTLAPIRLALSQTPRTLIVGGR